MNMESYNPIDLNKYGIHTWNYLYFKSKKWGKGSKGCNKSLANRSIHFYKKQSIDERKDPLFYSFKNCERNSHHNMRKKILTESLMSFNGNNNSNSNSNRNIKVNPMEHNSNCIIQKNDDEQFHLSKVPNRNESKQIESKEEKGNEDEIIDYDNDIRLEITMQKLGLEDLIHVFNNFNITFNDLLFLEKEDLDEMQLHLYQKNRLLTFINEYTKNSSQYTIGEILIFFNNNIKYKALAQNNNE